MSPRRKDAPENTAAEDDPGALESTATALVGRLIDLGIDGLGPLSSAQKVADSARAGARSDEKAIDDVVSGARKQAAAGGFVTGLGGFFTLPVSLPANVLGFYVIATRTVAAVAALRGFDLDDRRVRASVLVVLTGQDASGVLGKVGVGGSGGIVTRLLSSRIPPNTLMLVQKGVGFRILAQVGKGTLSRLGRFVPLAGGFIGAGSDVWILRGIVKTAKKEFTAEHLAVLGASPASEKG